VLESPT